MTIKKTFNLLHDLIVILLSKSILYIITVVFLLIFLEYQNSLNNPKKLSKSDEIYLLISIINFLIILSTIISSNFFKNKIQILYIFPVSSTYIATATFLCSLIILFFELFFILLLVNNFTGSNIPVIGPSFFYAVACVTQIALILAFAESCWIPIASAGAFLFELLWHKTRHGPFWESPTHDWTTVTPWEWLTMGSALIGSLSLASFAIAWKRRGDPITNFEAINRIRDLFSRKPETIPRLTTAHQAMFWAQWRKNGYMVPAFMTIFFGISIYYSLINNLTELMIFEMLVRNINYIFIFGIVFGSILGSFGDEDDMERKMGPFHASLPATSLAIAWNSLGAGGLALLFCGLIWVSPVLFLGGYLWFLGEGREIVAFMGQIPWWGFPLAFFLYWPALGAGFALASAGLTKRELYLIAAIFCLPLFTIFLIYKILSVEIFEMYFLLYIYSIISNILLISFIFNKTKILLKLYISFLLLIISILSNFQFNSPLFLGDPIGLFPMFLPMALVLGIVPLAIGPFAVFASRVR